MNIRNCLLTFFFLSSSYSRMSYNWYQIANIVCPLSLRFGLNHSINIRQSQQIPSMRSHRTDGLKITTRMIQGRNRIEIVPSKIWFFLSAICFVTDAFRRRGFFNITQRCCCALSMTILGLILLAALIAAILIIGTSNSNIDQIYHSEWYSSVARWLSNGKKRRKRIMNIFHRFSFET
jgi:hypothetical protein